MYYNEHSEELPDPSHLWRQITRPRETEGKGIGLMPSVRLERLDPLHRDFELDLKEDGTAKTRHGMPGDATFAVESWYAQIMAGQTNKPLWLYLENTEFCLDVGTPLAVDGIPYNQPGEDPRKTAIQAIRHDANAHRLQQVPWLQEASGFNWELFDTQWVTDQHSGKAGNDHAMAFIWSLQKELFVSLHNPKRHAELEHDRFHHSSFNSGNMVLAAGMIAARQGLVTFLSNNSGHYQPDTAHMLKLVRHLNKRFLFDQNAVIESLGASGGRRSVAGFIQHAAAQQPMAA